MSRLFLFLVMLAAAVAIAAFLVSIWTAAYDAGRAAMRPMLNRGKNAAMTPTGFQKVAYGVLIVLMFGVTTGLLGGL